MRTAGTAVVSGCQATRPGTGRRHIGEVSLRVCDIQEEVVVVLGVEGAGARRVSTSQRHMWSLATAFIPGRPGSH